MARIPWLRRLPLRTVLTAPFLVQIIIVASSVAYLVFNTAEMTALDLSERLRDEISARVRTQVESVLELPHALNESNAQAVHLGLLKLEHTQAARLYFQRQLMAQSELTLVGYGSEEPRYVDVARLDHREYLKLAMAQPGTTDTTNWKMDLRGQLIEQIPTDPAYDHRKRPWYNRAVSFGKPGWSNVYMTLTPERLVISATRPVVDDQAQLMGVAVSSLSLSGISEFLSGLRVGKTGQCFIMESSGEIVATSTGEAPFVARDGDTYQRLAATDSTNYLTRSTAAFLRTAGINVNSLDAKRNLIFDLHNQRQLVQVVPFHDTRGLSWLIVIVLPEGDVMAEIDARTHSVVLLLILALVFASLIGYLTAHWVTDPIRAINESASKLARGEWERTIEMDRADELGELAVSFNKMATQLHETISGLELRVRERTQQLAVALDRVEHLARHDELTGLMNRRAMQEELKKEAKRCQRSELFLYLAMIDLDHFKNINDVHGHAIGDLVLRGFARLAEGLIRDSDILSRWGGEEFLLALPETQADGALRVLTRLREEWANHVFDLGTVSVRMTMSVGVAVCRRGEDWSLTLERADAALYKAKSDGRNRIESDTS